MEDPLKRNFGLVTWRGKNFIAAADAPVHRPPVRCPPDYLRRSRNGLTSIFCLATECWRCRGRAGIRQGGGGGSADGRTLARAMISIFLA